MNNLIDITRIQRAIHETALSKGWWDSCYDDAGEFNPERRNQLETIALIHSELSEAVEGFRHGNPPSKHIPKFDAIEEEYADVIIRILDDAEARGFDVAGALLAKMEFNEGREYKHGKRA